KANPDKTGGEELTVREALEQSAEEIADDETIPWDVQAFLRYTVGDTLLWLGRDEEAIPHLERSLELRRTHLPELDHDVIWSTLRLSNAISRRGKPEQAVEMLNEPISRLRELNASGVDRRKDLAELLRVQSSGLINIQLPDDAWPLVEEAMSLFDDVGESDGPIADLLNSMGGIWMRQGKFDEAERAYLKALDIYASVHGEETPYWSITLNNYATMLKRARRYDEAEVAFRRVLEVDELLAGERETTPNLCMTTMNLGSMFADTGRFDEAEPMLRRSLAYHEALYHGEHQYQAFVMNHLARVLMQKGEREEAASMMEEAQQILEQQIGPRHPNVAVVISSRAALMADMERYEEAVRLYEESLAIVADSLGESHGWYLDISISLCRSLKHLDAEAAVARLDDLMERLEADPDQERLSDALHVRATACVPLERYTEAAENIRRCLALRDELGIGGDWEAASIRVDLGSCLARQPEHADEGAELMRSSFRELVSLLGGEDERVANVGSDIGVLLAKLGRAEEARAWGETLAELGIDVTGAEWAQ
ncbi:MAG: tetratricopeptide repeat protein, partial [Phycisphaerales bacterium]|nr:tetratricopeptide repeat protein [Phycisphaerales bacterium]